MKGTSDRLLQTCIFLYHIFSAIESQNYLGLKGPPKSSGSRLIPTWLQPFCQWQRMIRLPQNCLFSRLNTRSSLSCFSKDSPEHPPALLPFPEHAPPPPCLSGCLGSTVLKAYVWYSNSTLYYIFQYRCVISKQSKQILKIFPN